MDSAESRSDSRRDTVCSEQKSHPAELVPAVPVYPMQTTRGAVPPLARAGQQFQAGTPSTLSAGMLKALRYRKYTAVAAGITLGAIAAVAVWFLSPPKYTTFALLRVTAVEPRLLDENKYPNTDKTTYQKSQVALVASRPVLRAALKNPKVRQLPIVLHQADAAVWLEKQLHVGFIEDTDLLRIALSNPDPNDAAALVSAVQEAYLQEIVNAARSEQQTLLDELDRICVTSQNEVRRQREVLRGLADTLKTSDSQVITLKQKNLLDEYASKKRDLALLQTQVRQAQVKLSILETVQTQGQHFKVPEYLIDQSLDNDETIKKCVAEISGIEEHIRQRVKVCAKGAANLAPLERHLKASQERLEQLRASKRANMEERLRKRLREEGEGTRQQLKEEIAVLTRQQAELSAEVKQIGQEAEKIGTSSFELELKRAEIEQTESVIKALRTERERLRVELQSTNRRVTVIHSAEVPQVRNKDSQQQMTLLAGFGGLAVGLVGISFWEFRRRRINSADDVVSDLGMRVFGSLPDLRRHGGARPGQGIADGNSYGQQILVESIDSIRTMLFCDAAAHGCKVLMITSARSQEGKSTLAAYLAKSLARAGRKTILIDCDLRRPALHKLFDLPLVPGLNEVLQGRLELHQAIQGSILSDLDILSAGRYARSAIEALAKSGLKQLFDQLRGRYDYIVADSTPILPIPDALLIGKNADAVLLSVRPRISQAPLVKIAFDRLTDLHIRILGVVVNGEPAAPAYSHDYLVGASEPAYGPDLTPDDIDHSR